MFKNTIINYSFNIWDDICYLLAYKMMTNKFNWSLISDYTRPENLVEVNEVLNSNKVLRKGVKRIWIMQTRC
jgi:hypothetical protein